MTRTKPAATRPKVPRRSWRSKTRARGSSLPTRRVVRSGRGGLRRDEPEAETPGHRRERERTGDVLGNGAASVRAHLETAACEQGARRVRGIPRRPKNRDPDVGGFGPGEIRSRADRLSHPTPGEHEDRAMLTGTRREAPGGCGGQVAREAGEDEVDPLEQGADDSCVPGAR